MPASAGERRAGVLQLSRRSAPAIRLFAAREASWRASEFFVQPLVAPVPARHVLSGRGQCASAIVVRTRHAIYSAPVPRTYAQRP